MKTTFGEIKDWEEFEFPDKSGVVYTKQPKWVKEGLTLNVTYSFPAFGPGIWQGPKAGSLFVPDHYEVVVRD